MTEEPGSLDVLRAAAAEVEALEHDPAFDPAEHATRFEAVHDALVAVLAEIDTAGAPGRT